MTKKILILFVLLSTCSLIGFSQNITKKYTSVLGEDGTVYFIMPQKGFKSKGLPKEAVYDVTYNTKNDSVNYNFTYYSRDAVSVDSVGIISAGKETVYSAQTFFVSPKGNDWRNRISIHPTYEQLTEMHKQDSPYELKLYRGSKTYLMKMSKGEWKKQSAIVRRIQDVIELNRK